MQNFKIFHFVQNDKHCVGSIHESTIKSYRLRRKHNISLFLLSPPRFFVKGKIRITPKLSSCDSRRDIKGVISRKACNLFIFSVITVFLYEGIANRFFFCSASSEMLFEKSFFFDRVNKNRNCAATVGGGNIG